MVITAGKLFPAEMIVLGGLGLNLSKTHPETAQSYLDSASITGTAACFI